MQHYGQEIRQVTVLLPICIKEVIEKILRGIARRTPYWCRFNKPCNEAAILTAREEESINITEIGDSIDRIVAGMKVPSRWKSKRLITYHRQSSSVISKVTILFKEAAIP